MLTPLIITELSRVTAHPARRVAAAPGDPAQDARAARTATQGRVPAATRDDATSPLEGLA